MSFKGALRSHSSLVFAISEEKQVHETLLRLILGRVNASAALSKWAAKEENVALKEITEKLHQFTLMWSKVQKQFAEQYAHFRKTLEDILHVELGIDAIKQQYQDCCEKIEKLKKQLGSNKRRSDMSKITTMEEELMKSTEFQGELASELQAKALKAELFKNTRFKAAMLASLKTNLDSIANLFKIFSSASEIVEQMPDIPRHLGVDSVQKKNDKGEKGNMLAELSKELNSRIQSSSLGRQKSKPGHLDLVEAGSPPSPSFSPVDDTPMPHVPKRSESTKRPAQFRAQLGLAKDSSVPEKSYKSGRSKSEEQNRDFENVPAPNAKKESKIAVIKRKVSQGATLRRKKSQRRRGILGEPATTSALSADEASSGDDFEEPGYVCPNDVDGRSNPKNSPPRRRRASTGTLPTKHHDDYTDPWDMYPDDFSADTYDKYLEPYDAIADAITRKTKNEVQWKKSPLKSNEDQPEEADDIYDVIIDSSAQQDDDYIYDVILASPTEKSSKSPTEQSTKSKPKTPNGANGKKTNISMNDSDLVVGMPVQVNLNLGAPELPPRNPRNPGRPPRTPDQPIPSRKMKRVESEPAHLSNLGGTSPQSIQMTQSGLAAKPGSSPQRGAPPKPPRKAKSKEEASSKPPKLPPRRSETNEVDYSGDDDENSIYEPVNVNVKDMIAMLQEKSVKMPHLVNPMMPSGRMSPQ